MRTVCFYIELQLAKCKPLVVAIDGRCGGGKTTAAEFIADRFGGRIIHMDDFFLPPEKRSRLRLAVPGGNVDYERFSDELGAHLRENNLSYRAYNCKSGEYFEKKLINSPLTVVEGSYALHPELRHLYDFRVFVDIDSEKQAKRILNREGEERAQIFFDKWIPLEEKYFSAYDIQKGCHITIKMGE